MFHQHFFHKEFYRKKNLELLQILHRHQYLSMHSSEKEIRKYYKKPSNRDRLGEDIVEKKILEYLKQFAKVKEVEVKTKDIRGQNHEH